MASSTWRFLLALCLIVCIQVSGVSCGGNAAMEWMASSERSGFMGLADEEEEFELDSVSNRRILATRQYISYGALQRNNVPCSRRGASYYNCRPGAQANPYRRGCSAATRCRR